MEGKILQLYPEEKKEFFFGKPYRIKNIIQSDYFLENYYKGEHASYKDRVASGFYVRGNKKDEFNAEYHIEELCFLSKKGSAHGVSENLGCWLITTLHDLDKDDPVLMHVHFHPDYEDHPFPFPSNHDLDFVYLMKKYNFCKSMLNKTRNYVNPIIAVGKKVNRKKSILLLFQPKWGNLFTSLFETLGEIESKFAEFEPKHSEKIIDSYCIEAVYGRREFLGLHPKDFFDFIDYSGLYNTAFISLENGKISEQDFDKLCGIEKAMCEFRNRMPFKEEYKFFKNYGTKGVIKLLKRKALELIQGR